MRLALFLLLLAAIVFVLLATQDGNTEWVTLQLPFMTNDVSSPLIGWIAGSLGLGFLLGYLAALPGRFGAAARARKAEKQLAQVETTATKSVTSAHADAAQAARAARSADARADAAAHDAAETQRLADEVARRTAARDVPPPLA